MIIIESLLCYLLFINIKVKFKLDTNNNVRYLFHEIPLKLEYVISPMNYI